jgi:DNA polymerase-3 subunit chi
VTEIAFHFNAPDQVAYVCRLLRKAVASGAKVVVTGFPETLQQLDAALWTFSATDFVPHCHLGCETLVLAATPVILAASISDVPHQEVLVNLGHFVPVDFERFERVIEVVGLDDDDRQRARSRWKHYTDRHYVIKRHDLSLNTAL